jgi:NAD(P)-dependent dehydrogenase (short-subunit alcohol dehydrogenase family)
VSGTVLVVGATGILRPAAVELARTSRPVVAMARRAGPLRSLAAEADDVSTMSVDYTDLPALESALHGVRTDTAIVYAPAADEATIDQLQEHVAGRFVRLLTSAWAAPGCEPPRRRPDRVHLVLGWRRDGQWHTPGEVSAASLDVLRTGRDATLGVVRPWSDWPR